MLFPRRWLAKRFAANVAVSDHTGRRVALPRTQTIYHGIAETTWQDEAPSSRASEPLVLAYVGRLVPDKGVDVLLRAAGYVKRAGSGFRLKIIGDGPERRHLERLGEELRLKDCVVFIRLLRGELTTKGDGGCFGSRNVFAVGRSLSHDGHRTNDARQACNRDGNWRSRRGSRSDRIDISAGRRDPLLPGASRRQLTIDSSSRHWEMQHAQAPFISSANIRR